MRGCIWIYLIYFVEMIFTEKHLYNNEKSIAVWFEIFHHNNVDEIHY